VTDIATQQIEGEPKGIVWIKAWVSNTGKSKAAKTLTEFRVGNTRIGTVETPAVAKGKTVKIKIRWDARKPNGNYTITVRADYTGAIREKTETNNVSTLTVRIKNRVVTDVKFEQT
jgi:subtilase family serine protease